MKKVLAILLVACLTVSLLAACGSTDTGNKTEATTAAPQETVSETAAETTAPDVDIAGDDEKSAEEKMAEKVVKSAPGEYFGDLLTFACANGPSTFDPLAKNQSYGVSVNSFEKLAMVDNDGTLKLLLLKSLTEVDELTYECELWPFIYDTQGNNIKASDVEFSIAQHITAGGAGNVSRLDHIEVTGDYTFIWHNNAPFAFGEKEKQISNPSIYSKTAYDESPDHMASGAIGTAPYKLKEFVEGSYGIFEANEDYWFNNIDDEEWLAANDGVWTYQNYKEIRCDVIKDASARAIALENGAVDACTDLDAADIAAYKDNPDITTINIPVDPPVGFYFNLTENSPCSDVNLRKAICYAIDNAAIAAGLDVPAQAAFGIEPRMYDSPENWTTGEGRDYYNYNVEKAKECLAQSSYNGEPLTVIYVNKDQRGPAWILLQAQLKEVGINIELNELEQSSFDAAKYEFDTWDLLSETVGGGKYMTNTVKKWWSESVASALGGRNVCGVEDPELDRLYNELVEKHDEAALEAWDQYFTYDNCIGYGVALISKQTAGSSKYNICMFGSPSSIVPGAFTPAE